MPEIKEIRICGFRGIKSQLRLNFEKGPAIQSMVIYGRNGTGKSSITDAWEWFASERIEHLRREGAGPSSYKNKNAEDGETFVEIDFIKPELGSIKLTYDNARITRPSFVGEIEKFRRLAPHPCHIRFEDLTRFVYQSKTEKYDALAQLMGFVPQVEAQKGFRRILRVLKDQFEERGRDLNKLNQRLAAILFIEGEIDENSYLSKMNQLLVDNKIEAGLPIDLKQRKQLLNNLVINDPKAKRINLLRTTLGIINIPQVDAELINELNDYLLNVEEFFKNELEVSKLLMLELYEQGDKVFAQLDDQGKRIFSEILPSGEVVDKCPLCGQSYLGNLEEHFSDELKGLRKLKKSRDVLEKQALALLKKLPQVNAFEISYDSLKEEFDDLEKLYKLNEVKNKAYSIKEEIRVLAKSIKPKVENVMQNEVSVLKRAVTNIQSRLKAFQISYSDTEKHINRDLQALLGDDQARKKLVDDNQKFSSGLSLWDEIIQQKKSLSGLQNTYDAFVAVVDNFIASSISNVQQRLETISDDLKRYFEILEKDTVGLRGAVLKLIPEEDRAVELEIEFYGDSIYPAYKYLSESQLNSFGLSVFLASAKYFNSDFRFIVLDDIINSFDGYKRPRIIELLKQEFPNHQTLLLTHDNVWCDRLFEAFPASIKKRFIRWELNHGPIDVDGFAPLERIKQHLDRDEPVEAGRNLGPFLERQFQEIGENFEILVKYNRLNEYTLAPLLERFAARVKDKLGTNHSLFLAIVNLNDDKGFRNLSAHWKNPAIEMTKEEMNTVVSKWMEIEMLVRCQDDSCRNWLKFDSVTSSFTCRCGKTKLEKAKPENK